MSSYSTISIPKGVKQVLQKDKGDRDWGEYLLNLYEEAKTEKRARAFKKLRELLSEDDLKRILEESRLLRRSLALR
jgi:predicted CopG family antitoxin